MDDIDSNIKNILTTKKMCFIATSGRDFVDNAMVAYYSDEFILYFGSFPDTLKCRNIKNNSHVAVCVDSIQIHGKACLIEYGSDDYYVYMEKYLTKFPYYRFYFELQGNELYRIIPLVIWQYDSSKGTMHRDVIIFDQDYYHALKPYEAPGEFLKR
jgi:hypothetical protein